MCCKHCHRQHCFIADSYTHYDTYGSSWVSCPYCAAERRIINECKRRINEDIQQFLKDDTYWDVAVAQKTAYNNIIHWIENE